MDKFKDFKVEKEGSAEFLIPKESKITKKLPVFYNPVMKFNRDISVILLNSIDKTDMKFGLPLAGTGIRGVRLLKELDKDKLRLISFNDIDEKALMIIEKNLEMNDISKDKVELFNKEANLFLLEETGFDYLDIDPFGSPNPFLDNAIKRLSRDGILAVTATDTAPLCGTYPKTCKRKYWAIPVKNEEMHEIGLRILIRKIQLIGAQYERSLMPIFSYSKEHYFRVFLRCEKGKKKVDEIIAKHDMYKEGGPMWTGQLWDKKLIDDMKKRNNDEKINDFLDIVGEECNIDKVGFYDIHGFCKKNKLAIPKTKEIMQALDKNNIAYGRTHFTPLGIKAEISETELKKIILEIKKN